MSDQLELPKPKCKKRYKAERLDKESDVWVVTCDGIQTETWYDGPSGKAQAKEAAANLNAAEKKR